MGMAAKTPADNAKPANGPIGRQQRSAAGQCWMVTLRPSTLATAARPARAPLVMPCGRPSRKLVLRFLEQIGRHHTG